MTVDHPCVLCGRVTSQAVLYQTHRPVLQCPTCNLVATAGEAPHEDVAYDERYYRGFVYADYLADRPAIRRNAARALTEIERAVVGRRLLDIGCATGFFLEVARERGWAVHGLEVSQYASRIAREELKLDVERASILAPPPNLGTFDVITMWDVIEHLERPDHALCAAAEHLNSGGLLLVSTGDFDSLLRRATGEKWRLFSDPTHRFFFTPSTLSQLLQKAGLHVTSVDHRGKFVSLLMGLYQSPLRPLSRWLGRHGVNLTLPVNLWDVMTVFAVKRG